MNKSTLATISGLIFLFTSFSNTTLAQNTYDKLCNQGSEYEKTGNLDDAIGKYTDAIISNPKLWIGYSYRSKANFKKQKYDEAIADISLAINLSPETISLFEDRAACYITKGIYDKALQDLDSYLSVKPNDVRAIFYQGLSFLKVGDTAKARTNASRIIDIDHIEEVLFSGEHLLDIYDLEMRRKVVKQSLEDAHAYMEEVKSTSAKVLSNIKLTEAFQKLNNAWLNSSGIEKEDRDLRQAIINDIYNVYPKMKDKPEIPETARKYMIQANGAMGDKKYDDAKELLNRVINISPYCTLAYFNAALVYELTGNYKTSIEAMKTYLELYPDAPDARGAQDKIYEWEGKVKPLEEIVKKYTAANKLDKITEISTIKIKAKWSTTIPGMSIKPKENIEIWMKNPNKIKTIIKAFPIESIEVFDGEKGYSDAGSKQPHEMTPYEAKETLKSIVFQNSLAYYLDNGQLSLEGEEMVKGRNAFKIQVRGEKLACLYIDEQSYLLVKSVTIINQGGKTFTREAYLSNYTETNGVLLPMKTTTISHSDAGETTEITTYEKVEVNIPMDDSLFKVKNKI